MGPSWDLDKLIRPQEEVMRWVEHCPIKIFEEFLIKEHILTTQEKEQICGAIEEEIEKAVRFAEESPYPEADDFLSDVFKE